MEASQGFLIELVAELWLSGYGASLAPEVVLGLDSSVAILSFTRISLMFSSGFGGPTKAFG